MCAVDAGIDKINCGTIVIDQILSFGTTGIASLVPNAVALVVTRGLRSFELSACDQRLTFGMQAGRNFFNWHVDRRRLIQPQQNRSQHHGGSERADHDGVLLQARRSTDQVACFQIL